MGGQVESPACERGYPAKKGTKSALEAAAPSPVGKPPDMASILISVCWISEWRKTQAKLAEAGSFLLLMPSGGPQGGLNLSFLPRRD